MPCSSSTSFCRTSQDRSRTFNIPGPGPDIYPTSGRYSSLELMVRAHEKSPTSSFLVFALFSDALGLPGGGCINFLRPRGWKAAGGRYRALFAAFEIRLQDVLLRIAKWRLYINPHVVEYLVGLDPEWENT